MGSHRLLALNSVKFKIVVNVFLWLKLVRNQFFYYICKYKTKQNTPTKANNEQFYRCIYSTYKLFFKN